MTVANNTKTIISNIVNAPALDSVENPTETQGAGRKMRIARNRAFVAGLNALSATIRESFIKKHNIPTNVLTNERSAYFGKVESDAAMDALKLELAAPAKPAAKPVDAKNNMNANLKPATKKADKPAKVDKPKADKPETKPYVTGIAPEKSYTDYCAAAMTEQKVDTLEALDLTTLSTEILVGLNQSLNLPAHTRTVRDGKATKRLMRDVLIAMAAESHLTVGFVARTAKKIGGPFVTRACALAGRDFWKDYMIKVVVEDGRRKFAWLNTESMAVSKAA
jgi:hypothetical protein